MFHQLTLFGFLKLLQPRAHKWMGTLKQQPRNTVTTLHTDVYHLVTVYWAIPANSDTPHRGAVISIVGYNIMQF